ncbi:MAG: zinc ABC transporter ATP-binding protein AztA [Anaerolineae bacterium]
MSKKRKFYAHQEGAPSISAEGISLQYDGHKALEDVTFRVETGERVAVVGPNGAGKSTLFQVLAGIIHPTEGMVRLFGGAPERHMCIAYVPQRSQVDVHFPVNVRDVVMMGRAAQIGPLHWANSRDRAIVQECLDTVGMADLARRQIGELSGGQQQRVFIARSLAQESEIMLLDEPLNGLDVNSQEDILQILDELKRRQVTVLVATHDLNQASRCYDRVMLLNHRLIAFGTADEVFSAATLSEAYGDQLRLLNAGEGVLALSDSCCGGGC